MANRQPDEAVKSAGLSKVIAVITVCKGPPACMLKGDAAMAHQIAGCVWCDRISVYEDGSETREGPARD